MGVLREHASWDDGPNTSRSGMISACRARSTGFQPWPVLCWEEVPHIERFSR